MKDQLFLKDIFLEMGRSGIIELAANGLLDVFIKEFLNHRHLRTNSIFRIEECFRLWNI